MIRSLRISCLFVFSVCAALPTWAAEKAATAAAPAVVAPLPPPAPALALYLTWQRDPARTMTIHWHSDWSAGFRDTVLEYRASTAPVGAWQRAEGRSQPLPFTQRMVHTVELTALAPDTTYVFRLGTLRTREKSTALDFVSDGGEHRFRTMPAALTRPVRFVAGGDANVGQTTTDGVVNEYQFARMNRAAAARDPEFALLGGDIAYVNNEPKAVAKWFDFLRLWGESMRAPDGRLVPIVPAIGNHEVHGDAHAIRGGAPERGVRPERASLFYTLFAFPGTPGYNVLDFGGYLSVVALDSFHTNPVPGPQTDWLRATLSARPTVPWIVPIYHVPAYPSHRAFSGAVSVAIRANWIPLFDDARVRFAFENHDHVYKVTHPLRAGKTDPAGTRYLGDGAWSVTTRDFHAPDKAPYLERVQKRNHVFVVTLQADRADFVAVDPAGEEFDRFTIPVRP
ncbi:MAG: metallophosphoesterase family protein [Opitutaceae bacterium]|nr:metallophosphoesterase family protein [Opitutaceae bacterium]